MAAGSSTGSGSCCGARGFSCSGCGLDLRAHGASIGRVRRTQGPIGRPFARRSAICSDDQQSAQNRERRASISRSSGPGCTSGRRRATSTSRRCRGASSAIGAAVGVLVLGVALAVMIPRIDDRQERARRGRSALDEARGVAPNRARMNHPRSRDTRRPRAAARRGRLRRRAARRARAALDDSRPSIFADARARATARREAPGHGPTTCERAPGTPPGGDVGVFDCFVVTGSRRPSTTSPGAIGYPFRAVVDYATFAYAWCKAEQIPGEKLILDPKRRHPPAADAEVRRRSAESLAKVIPRRSSGANEEARWVLLRQ